jgi:glycerophosphoryl diester phosphodiesterase
MVHAMSRPLIIAHGRMTEHVDGPALEAFADIIETGVDMLEFDVRRAGDGVLVVAHDAVTVSACAATPSVEDLLRVTRGRVALDIELKERGCAAHAIALALGSHDAGELLVTAFDPEAIREAKAADGVRTGYIVEHADAFDAVAELDVDYLVPSLGLVRAGILDAASSLGLPSLVWGVNAEPDMATLLEDSRVAGLITDRPDLALRVRDRLRHVYER